MKIKLIIDSMNYSTKPLNYEPGKIIKRMTIDTMKEYSIEEIKKNILDGKTIRPSYCGAKEDSWKLQQIFMIDIDNEAKLTDSIVLNDFVKMVEGKKNKVKFLVGSEQHKSYDEIINHCKDINVVPNFVYTSFNHKSEQHKMRLVFILDKEITDFNVAKKIQLYLMNSVGEVDEQCKNLNRIYYAGKDIVFDSGNVLDSGRLIELSGDIEKNGKVNGILHNNGKSGIDSPAGRKGTNILNEYNNLSNILVPLYPSDYSPDYNTYNIKAITNRDINYLKKKISNEAIDFDNEADFWHYVYHNINMAELLEFKYPSSVKCIFHNDNSPSASIFQTDEGVWLYKCHSSQCSLTMNIKQLIEKLGNFKSEYKAIEFIKSIYNLSIKETKWSIEQKANLDSIINTMNINKFAELCPQADKNIRYVKELFLAMVSLAKDNVYGENYMNSDGDAVFFVSLSELAKIMKVYTNNLNKISQRIAVLVYHDLVRKLDDDKIPEVMLKKAQAISIDKDTDKRVSFYSIPSWVFEQLKQVEIQGNKWKKYGYTVKGTSYEMFYRAEGLEAAQKIYPQHKKVKLELIDYDTGEITTVIKDRTTSKVSDDRVKKIIQSIHNLIDEKGYTTEKELIYYLSKEYLWEVTKIQLRKMRGELNKLGYKRIKVNKELKNQLGIVSNGYPFLIVKNE